MLFAGQSSDTSTRGHQTVPAALGTEGDQVAYERKRERRGTKASGGKRKNVKDLDVRSGFSFSSSPVVGQLTPRLE